MRDVLATHQLTLTLFHGLAFFIVGFSTVFLAQRSARIEVARNLTMLAFFGFFEAVVAWSPIWNGEPSTLNSLYALIRLFLLGAGYALLATFALQILLSLEKQDHESWMIVGGLFSLWLIGLAVASATGLTWEQIAIGGEVAARYALALPGGLVGALGLRRQAYRTIGPGRLKLVQGQ